MNGENLDYNQQSKKGKLQIISFIRKQYNGADFRDIYTGLHKAILKDGKLIGVSTNLNMIYNLTPTKEHKGAKQTNF